MSINSIDDLKQDMANPNKGNAKGRELIGQSLEKFGAGRSILIDKNGNILAGNNVQREAAKRGMKIKVVETTRDELVVVQRTDIDLYSEEGRELSLADNVTAKTNITWDKKILKTEFADPKLNNWGLTVEKKIKSTPEKWMPSIQFKSGNDFEIPDLLITHQALNGLVTPFVPWGAQKRSSQVGSYHFYVDDYRFQTIYEKPDQVIKSGCVAVVEPNFSTTDDMPIAYALFLIFKKRYFARLMQEAGVRVYVDLHVCDRLRQYNEIGIPSGWNAFATRGYGDDLEGLKSDIDQAKKIAGAESINMVVCGGGKQVKKIAEEHGCFYLKSFTQKFQHENTY